MYPKRRYLLLLLLCLTSLDCAVRAEATSPIGQLSLSSPAQVPLIVEGRQVGTIGITAGSKVNVLKIEEDGITIAQGVNVFKIARDRFDTSELDALAKAQATPSPSPLAAPTPSATPSPSPAGPGSAAAMPEAVLTAPVYQWSAEIDPVGDTETKKKPRAYLWIPPNCQKVRGIVIGEHNMEEAPILEHPAFRRTLADLGFAEIYITPPMGSIHFRFDKGAGESLEKLLKELAQKSGYAELEQAPLIPIGHSAAASFCWDMAAWKPDRALAVISTSGQWPYFFEPGGETNIGKSPDWGGRTVDSVPGITTKGEYEVQGSLSEGWYAGIGGETFKHRKMPFSQVVEPGGGHFEVSDNKVDLLSLYLRKAAQYRLPTDTEPGQPVKLREIDPTKGDGWYYEGWVLDTPPKNPAAPVVEFKGDKSRAYWAFDGEMAKVLEEFQGKWRNRQPLLLAYKQKNGLVEPRPDHFMVHLKFEPMEDGVTFKLDPAFWDKVPGDHNTNPAVNGGKEGTGGWGNSLLEDKARKVVINPGDPIDHPADKEGLLKISPICGPVKQIDSNTFSVRFDRVGVDNPKRSGGLCFALTFPGDEKFKPMVQQAELKIPVPNTKGTAQSITFPSIPDQKASPSMPPVQLAATASSGLPVYYYVREGPALVNDRGLLTFTPIPPKASYPIPVTVVAWQYGRSTPTEIQSAQPVEQTFRITAP